MSVAEAQPTVDEAALMELTGRIVGDLAATLSAALVVIGEKHGLYRALADAGPLTAPDLAQRTGTTERYVREWLLNQAAGGYVSYAPDSGRYHLTPEQAFALADESSPAYMPGAFQLVTSVLRDEPAIADAFASGRGLDWGEHDPGLFEGTERFFAPGYRANLVGSWIPALDGVREKLEAGARVADIGCGHCASTIIMAGAFPRSRFFGFDSHPASIDRARRRATEGGVDDRVEFAVASGAEFPGTDYDLVAFFDCLHDMGDPVAAATHVRQALAPDGTMMLVEPYAGDRIEDNLNPIGRLYSAASTMICVPASLAHEGVALGAQAGEARLREVVTAAGFGRFRRATETPVNLILEARP